MITGETGPQIDLPKRWSFLRPSSISMGAPFYPLVVLFLLNLVVQLDQTGFSVILPNIEQAFHLSGEGILALIALSSPLSLLLGLLVGYLGDRLPRTPFVRGGAAVWAAFCALTGLAPNVGLLLL